MKIKNEEKKDICKNVFKDGKDRPEKEEYNKKWIKILNAIERRKMR